MDQILVLLDFFVNVNQIDKVKKFAQTQTGRDSVDRPNLDWFDQSGACL